MDAISICGGNALCGEVEIQGSKNGALPLLAASVLIEGRTILNNCPKITDVEHMIKLLEHIGCKITRYGCRVEVDASNITGTDFPECHTKVMRSSIMLLGAMLGRVGEVTIDYPGGCVIGERPIDLHMEALSSLGVCFYDSDTKVEAKMTHMQGGVIQLPFPSVGATENVILASVISDRTTIIKGCAKEPEIVELCRFLNYAGARIEGAGSDCIKICGVKKLQEVCYRVMPDRIVAGTYLLAGVMTRGIVVLQHAPVEQLRQVFGVLQQMGADLAIAEDWVFLNGENAHHAVQKITTRVYPGFPTDLQSATLAVLAKAKGCSILEETIFESRYKIVSQLQQMGADIQVSDNRAVICGVDSLEGCVVEAEELRGGAALVLAGLGARGTTLVKQACFIDRGYENICRDLKALGAKITGIEYEKQ